jgi:hypothetical protein
MADTTPFNCEIPKALHVQAKLYSATTGLPLRIIMERALADYLRARGCPIPEAGEPSQLQALVSEVAVVMGPVPFQQHLEQMLQAHAAKAA